MCGGGGGGCLVCSYIIHKTSVLFRGHTLFEVPQNKEVDVMSVEGPMTLKGEIDL